jgi:hypothetical protein
VTPAIASLTCFWNSTTRGKGAIIPKVIVVGHALFDAFHSELILMDREIPEALLAEGRPPLNFKSAKIERGLSPYWLIEGWY